MKQKHNTEFMQKQESDLIPYEALKTVAQGKTLVFAPHPDDEVFGCGGAIIKQIQQCDQVHVVIVTDGGFPVNEHQYLDEYKETRKEESRKAAKVLCYGEPEFLDYPDRRLKFDEKLIIHLLEIIKQFQPQNIYLPALSEIHADHRVLSKAATEAARRYEPDINLYYYEIGQMQSANRLLDITGLQERLNSAMDCFPSQLKVQEAIIQVFQRHKELYKEIPEAWGYCSTIENQFYATCNSPKLIKKYRQNMTEPIFTIVTPTNKRPILLKRAINSVLSQSFKDFEQIIVDDANDPETARVVAEFNNEKLRYYVHNKQRGAAGAYNTGMKLARGRFINFLGDDDEYLPGILEKIHQTFTGSKNEIGFVWTGITRVKDTEKGEETLITQVWPAKFETRENGLMVSTAIGNGFGLSVRKECIDEIGYYDESLMIGEDTDFMIRLSARYDFLTVPEVMVKIHQHGDTQLTSEKYFETRRQCYIRIIERHFDFLSKHWAAFYIHSKACANLSYYLKRKKTGRKTLWSLIRKYPSQWIIYADFVCYELFGVDYKTWHAEKKVG